MKKIPTLFERDWDGDRSRVIDKVHPACAWVIAGEGTATQKLDGTSCLVQDGKLFRRRELRKGEAVPPLFVAVDFDKETGKTFGWIPCEPANPADRWHIEAFSANYSFPNGTYELLGPKVNGNPEFRETHILVPHDNAILKLHDVPRTFEELRAWMIGKDMEGVVWHHRDGRMAKLKLRDFGFRRPTDK
jgi:hypothetical protein